MREIHFDKRFGGLYTDLIHTKDISNTYTFGYMLPLESADGTKWFPSVNYSYVDFDTNGIADSVQGNCDNLGEVAQADICELL